MRTGLVDVVQVIYNIFDQSPEDKLFAVCRELNIGVIARVPLDEGSLGGKMTVQTKVSRQRLALEILRPGKSQTNAGAGGQTEVRDSAEHESAGCSIAIYPVEPNREHRDRRNEETETTSVKTLR